MAVKTVIKTDKQKRPFCCDMLIMLILPAVMAWYYYGGSVLRTVFVCMLTGVLSETAGAFFMRCPRDLGDCSSLFTGAAMALMLPADFPVWAAAAGVVFAVAAVKLQLGGTGLSPFNTVAAGFSFLCLCWPDKIFNYPAIDTGSGYVKGASLAGMLSVNTSIRPNTINVFDIFTGNVPGPAGASCIIVLLGCAVFLGFSRRRSLINSAGFTAACALFALMFPRVYSYNARPVSLLMELCSGLLMFSALFLVTDPAVSPEKPFHRFLYGAFSGAACMLLRYFGKFEEGVCFALLLSNAMWPPLYERILRRESKRELRKRVKRRSKNRALSAERRAPDNA